MRLLLILVVPLLSIAQQDPIAYIRQQFREINANVQTYEKVVIPDIDVYKDLNPESYSHESAQIHGLSMVNMTRYYHKDKLAKIVLTFDGERQQLTSEYYYDNNGLLFTFQRRTDYDAPKWSDTFDEKEKSIRENRYYFNKGQLIRWIDETGKKNELQNKTLEERAKKVLSDSELYCNYKNR